MATPQPPHGGAADSYYTGDQPAQVSQQTDGYDGQLGDGGQDPKYTQQPPNYGQTWGAAPPLASGGKQTFEQSFKLDKPKYNDLWAGILVGALAR